MSYFSGEADENWSASFWKARDAEEGKSLIGDPVSAMSNFASGAMGGARNTFSTAQEMITNPISKETWILFFALLLGGGFLMTLALAFLPMIMFAPQKFSMLFTLGSLCWIAAFAVLKGPFAFVSHLMARERIPFSLAYLCSIAGTMWAAEAKQSYILTIAFVGIQIVSLLYFLVSYIPGGSSSLTMALKMVGGMCKSCCPFGKKDSFIPL